MFRVELKRTGHSFEIDGKTPILTAALQAGYFLSYSCRQGMCGMCEGTVMEGRIEHGSHPKAEADGGPGPALLCQAVAASDLVLDVAELEMVAGPRRLPCRVIKLEKLTSDVALLRVQVHPNERLRFSAGQFVEFEFGNLRRSYSIANSADEAGCLVLEFHIKHRPSGAFTDHVFGNMKSRDMLRLKGPLGAFFLRGTQRPIILCATGTGFAPVKAILETAFGQGVPERSPIHFYWGGRTMAEFYMLDQVEEWVTRYPGFFFHPVLSRGVPDGVAARAGYIQQTVLEDFADLSGYQVYACGSSSMINAARDAFIGERGLPASEFYADEFLPASDSAAVIPSNN